MAATKLTNLINPQVMADMISAALPKRIKFRPIAKIDTTLVDQPGNTITVPKYAYIGDAEDVAEGVKMGTVTLTATQTQTTVKKAGKAVEITDEAALSGYGNPTGEAQRQLGLSIASKIDGDCYAALKGASLKHNGSAAPISYDGIVSAADLFESESEEGVEGVIFVNPKQITTLRKDPNFLDINKYPISNGVIMTGVIGKIAGFQVVPSKRVEKDSTAWVNPLVVIDPKNDDVSADEQPIPALTIYMKRDVLVESDRDILAKTTITSADEHYAVALSNDSKVVLATFKA